MNRDPPCKNAPVDRLPVEWPTVHPHAGGMKHFLIKHFLKILISAWLGCSPLLGQGPLNKQIEDAVRLEEQGKYAPAINLIKNVLQTAQLNSVELARADIMLGFANRGLGNFIAAENAFDRSLRILEHDPNHIGDYAAALQNYAALYVDLGQYRPAQTMWEKALRLRRQQGNHADAARALLDLAELQVAEKQLHKARRYVDDASQEMKVATDLLDDDRIAFLETDAFVALQEGQAMLAVAGFRASLELCIRTYGQQHWLTGWEHALLGKAQSQMGDSESALANVQEGMAILNQVFGSKSRKSLFAQTLYSQVLDRAGQHLEATRMKETVEQERKDLGMTGCPGCTINVAGFR
jgi:tetratricopeptide (TPR) repeat protein